jgi:hypothetical protein
VIVAFGTTAPDESVTAPRKEVVEVCDHAATEKNNASNNPEDRTTTRESDLIRNLLHMFDCEVRTALTVSVCLEHFEAALEVKRSRP